MKREIIEYLRNRYLEKLERGEKIECIGKTVAGNNGVEYPFEYRNYKNLIGMIREAFEKKMIGREDIEKMIEMIQMCDKKSYNQYLAKVDPMGLFFHLRNYHKDIKHLYLKKYVNKKGLLLMDVGSSQLKSLRFWKQLPHPLAHVYAMEPAKELYEVGMKMLKKDRRARQLVTFLRAAGEEEWRSGAAGLTDFSKRELVRLIEGEGVKMDLITFEFTFHYMIYKYGQLMKNIEDVSKVGTHVIIHSIDGDYLMNYFREHATNRYEVRRGDDVVFYAELVGNQDLSKSKSKSQSKSKSKSKSKLQNKKSVNIYFKGAQGLDNVIMEQLVLREDLDREFGKIGFERVEITSFEEQNYREYQLDDYEFQVSRIYTSFVYQKVK